MQIDESGRINRWDRVPTPPATRRGGFADAVAGFVKFVLKLAISPAVGGFLAGIAAGLLEAFGVAEVDSESPLALLLFLVGTVVVWRFLSRRGPLRRRF